MRIGRLEERHGRVLKLGGGMLMGLLGIVMLVDPGVLEDVTGAAIVLGAAAALTATAIALHAGATRLRAAPETPPPRAPAPRTRGRHAHRHP
jgi:drug/metabolite transporter (DMT)-like permease